MPIERDILKTAAIVVALCALYAGVVYWPSQKQNQALADQIQVKQQTVDGASAPDLGPLRRELAALRAELRDRPVDLPQGDAPYRVLDRVSDAITTHGVTVYNTNQRDPMVYARFSVTPVDVEFDSRFGQAFAILRAIEASDPPVRIERLELNGHADDPVGYVSASVELSSFFVPRGAEGGTR